MLVHSSNGQELHLGLPQGGTGQELLPASAAFEAQQQGAGLEAEQPGLELVTEGKAGVQVMA